MFVYIQLICHAAFVSNIMRITEQLSDCQLPHRLCNAYQENRKSGYLRTIVGGGDRGVCGVFGVFIWEPE